MINDLIAFNEIKKNNDSYVTTIKENNANL